MSRRHDQWALVALLGWLAVANVTRTYAVPDGAHFVWNLGTAAVATVIGLRVGLGARELGLGTGQLRPGLRLGALAFVIIAASVALAAALPATTAWFDDDRARVDAGAMLLRVAVVIPLGTVLVEELVFRGVLHGLLLRITSLRTTFVIGSLTFGLWHVLPVLHGADGAPADRATLAAATFVATALFGAVFIWLRHRSESLAAPVLAHIATNSVAFVAAWILR